MADEFRFPYHVTVDPARAFQRPSYALSHTIEFRQWMSDNVPAGVVRPKRLIGGARTFYFSDKKVAALFKLVWG